MKTGIVTTALLFIINFAFSQNVILKYNTKGGTEIDQAKSDITYKFELAGIESDNDAKEFSLKATKYNGISNVYVHPYAKGGMRKSTITTKITNDETYMKGFMDYMGIKDLIINDEKVKTSEYIDFVKKIKSINNK